MKIFQKNNVKAGEIAMYELLNLIADKYNPTFATLRLPKAITIDFENSMLSLPFYEGETFNDRWNSATGGALLGLDLSMETPALLEDLLKIDVTTASENARLKIIPHIQFKPREYLKDFKILLNRFVGARLITKAQSDIARTLLKKPFTSPLMLNNGDFYPRNFIRMSDGKIVLIDWETWNENSRACVIDHLENVAAYCFVHMWANAPWQKNYVRELKKRFTIKQEDFQKAIVIKSAEMAQFWFEQRDQNQLCDNQIRLFNKALSQEYMEDLWL